MSTLNTIYICKDPALAKLLRRDFEETSRVLVLDNRDPRIGQRTSRLVWVGFDTIDFDYHGEMRCALKPDGKEYFVG